jgi:hypothetical protein
MTNGPREGGPGPFSWLTVWAIDRSASGHTRQEEASFACCSQGFRCCESLPVRLASTIAQALSHNRYKNFARVQKMLGFGWGVSRAGLEIEVAVKETPRAGTRVR